MTRYRSSVHRQGNFRPEPRGTVRPCVDGGDKCPDGCGATLKTTLDRQTHRCDLFGTTRAGRMGDRRTRSAI